MDPRKSSCGAFRSLGIVLALLFVSALPPALKAQTATVEYAVKAAFLLNFAKFTEWTPSAFETPQSPIEICLLGADPFGRTIDDLVKGDSVDGRQLVVRRITRIPRPPSCQVLFVNRDVRDLKQVLAEVGDGTLIVGEGDRFLAEGGIVSFVVADKRVRFDINQRAAVEHGVRLSSRLLGVARNVTRELP